MPLEFNAPREHSRVGREKVLAVSGHREENAGGETFKTSAMHAGSASA